MIDSKPLRLIPQTRGERAKTIEQLFEEKLEELKQLSLEAGLRAEGEELSFKLTATTKLEFETRILSVEETQEYLQWILDSRQGQGLSYYNTKYLTFLKDNCHRTIEWWSDRSKRTRSKVYDMVCSGSLQRTLSKLGIKCKFEMDSRALGHRPCRIAFSIRKYAVVGRDVAELPIAESKSDIVTLSEVVS